MDSRINNIKNNKKENIIIGQLRSIRIAYRSKATMPPRDEIRKPISVDESTAKVFAP